MTLEQIGLKLKQNREAQGLSLRQIYEKTKIPVAHLQAIDAGQVDDLPEPVYVANYIRRYANCVGLGGDNLSDEYRKLAALLQAHNKQSQKAEPVYLTPRYVEGMKLDSPPPTFKTIYFNAIMIVGVVFLVCYLSMQSFNNQVNQQDPSLVALRESTSKFVQKPGDTTQNLPASGLPAASQTGEPVSGLPSTDSQTRISLSASQHVWVEVKSQATGESLFNGYLEQGDRRDFEDGQGLSVRAGNGASLTVGYMGKTETLGEAGKITERTFGQAQTTQATANAKPDILDGKTASAPVKKTPAKADAHHAPGELANNGYHRTSDSPERQYGDYGSAGTRSSSDVPYRYSEGRLDSD